MNRSNVVMAATLVAVSLLSCAPAASAETILGFEGGMGFATMNGDATAFLNPVAGPAGGVFARFGINGALSLQTGASLTTKGGGLALGPIVTLDGLPRTGLYDSKDPNAVNLRAQMLEVPLLLRIKPDRSEALSPTLSVGPSFGFQLSKSVDSQYHSLALENTKGQADVGLVLGIGVEKPHGGSRWSFDARTTVGHTNLEARDYQVHGVRNVSLVTMLGYGFSLGAP